MLPARSFEPSPNPLPTGPIPIPAQRTAPPTRWRPAERSSSTGPRHALPEPDPWIEPRRRRRWGGAATTTAAALAGVAAVVGVFALAGALGGDIPAEPATSANVAPPPPRQ
ncbi:hypothetical protein [Pseudonocardia sp. TRM90224]|uniref:hypothetical protein n=1 Tax=Pseudonocardia sp. TRM90224 TaxID=2812678 RepID=UPI001E3A7E0D|nr:hypothetical protein [Pseudonocardia sp. TRM90224]